MASEPPGVLALEGCMHFSTGDRTGDGAGALWAPNGTFLEDGEYSRALDSIVKGCADILLRDATTGRVLLGKRKVRAQGTPSKLFLPLLLRFFGISCLI